MEGETAKKGCQLPNTPLFLGCELASLFWLATTRCSVSVCSTRSAIRLEAVATMVLAWLAMTLAVTLAVVEVTVMLAWVVVVVVTKVAAVVMWLVVRRWRTAVEIMVSAYSPWRCSYVYNDLLWSAVA